MRRLSIITCLSLFMLAACGGGGASLSVGSSGSGGSSSGGSSSGGSSGGAIAATSLTALSSATTIPVDGSQTVLITVLARNASNNLISGVPVAFNATTGGGIAVGQGTTNSSGAATATLSAVGATVGSSITVTATAGGLTATVKVSVVNTGSGATTAVASLNLTTSSTTIATDGSTTATITALALDAGSNVLSGVPVSFKTTSTDSGTAGALQVSQPSLTGPAGTLTAILSAGGNTTERTVTVTGSTASLSSTVQVFVKTPSTPTSPIYSMGYGNGSGFVPSIICLFYNQGNTPPCAANGSLSAGGATSLALTITDQTGTLYNGGPVTVTFNSPCLAGGRAQILPNNTTTPTLAITTSTGSIAAQYIATGCSGADTIKASATIAGQQIGATGTLTVTPATAGSIQFVSASNMTIGLRGTGLSETSTVIFKVTDGQGNALANQAIWFTLDTNDGGISVAPGPTSGPGGTSQSALSAADGTVKAVVSAGTVHTVVRVTAQNADPATSTPPLSTQSSLLTVTTGLPTSGAFSIAIGAASNAPAQGLTCPNVEGFDLDGITAPLTVRLADRYNNLVPDGTAIAFQTDGGHIVGSCTTGSAFPGGSPGACTVTWTSANPRPGVDPTVAPNLPGHINLGYGYPTGYPPLLAAGRAVVLATTIGEESFTDLDASGYYKAGDPFADLGEPFEDDDEQFGYHVGDPYLNFLGQSAYVGPSGTFVGIICNGSAPGSTCNTSKLAIGVSHLIVMSTSGAYYPKSLKLSEIISADGSFGGTVDGGLTIVQGASGVVSVQLKDQNGNAMAAGTSVGYSFSNPTAGVTVTPIAPSSVPCDGDLGGETFSTNFATTVGKAGGGTLVISITSPGGTVSTYSVGITVQ